MKKKIVLGVVAAVVGLGIYIYHLESRPHIFEMYFLHLSKGHGVFIRTTHDTTILIDGGQNSEIIRELTRILPFYRRRIDTVIVTNGLPKNVGGLVDVVKRFEIGEVKEPVLMSTSTALEAFHRKLKINPENLKRGDSFEIDGVKFDVLFPAEDYNYNKSSTPEFLLKITYGTSTILLAGDSSKSIQNFISKDIGKVHILEFAHNATKSRVSADFVRSLEPDTIVSAKREETLRFQIK